MPTLLGGSSRGNRVPAQSQSIFQKIPSNHKGKKIKVTVEKPDGTPLMRRIGVNVSRNRTRVPPDRTHQGEHGIAKVQILSPAALTHSQTKPQSSK